MKIILRRIWRFILKCREVLEIEWQKTCRFVRIWTSSVYNWLRGLPKGEAFSSVADCLVICAHPDDETIFFSRILKENKPFVLCMSGRGHKVRKMEFHNALNYWGIEGVQLNFPDIPGCQWVWKRFAARKLRRLMKCFPNVRTVYTHSGTGESGHPHHYAVYHGVKEAFRTCKIYTTASEIPANGTGSLTKIEVKEKYGVIQTCYPSQIRMLERWCPWWESYINTEYFEE